MNFLDSSHSVVKSGTTRNKCRLIIKNELMKNILEPIGENFGEQFIQNITQRYRSPFLHSFLSLGIQEIFVDLREGGN